MRRIILLATTTTLPAGTALAHGRSLSTTKDNLKNAPKFTYACANSSCRNFRSAELQQ
jgi:hypothetical protein